MSKYNITIETMQSETFPFEATGRIGEQEFQLRTIMYNGDAIFKVVENGMCPAPTTMSAFTRGQRSAIAAFAKRVQADPKLIGESSQTVGSTSGPSRAQKHAAEIQTMSDEISQLKELIASLSNPASDSGLEAFVEESPVEEVVVEEPEQTEPPKRRRRSKKNS